MYFVEGFFLPTLCMRKWGWLNVLNKEAKTCLQFKLASEKIEFFTF